MVSPKAVTPAADIFYDLVALRSRMVLSQFSFNMHQDKNENEFIANSPIRYFLIHCFPLMRNTTKLKQILLKYDLALSLAEENLMRLTLVDKFTGKMQDFDHSSYSHLIGKGYGYLLKSLKADLEKPNKKRKPAQ